MPANLQASSFSGVGEEWVDICTSDVTPHPSLAREGYKILQFLLQKMAHPMSDQEKKFNPSTKKIYISANSGPKILKLGNNIIQSDI